MAWLLVHVMAAGSSHGFFFSFTYFSNISYLNTVPHTAVIASKGILYLLVVVPVLLFLLGSDE